jgi:hypothetical protein
MKHQTPCPEAILTAIPWYPDGLTPEEAGAVEAHAADCRDCRAELAFLRGDEEPTIEVPDPEEVYARVLERIGRSDDGEETAADVPAAHWLRALSQRAAGPVSVAAGLLVAMVSGMMTTGVIWAVRVAPAYETASAVSAGFDGDSIGIYDAQHLEIVFAEDATAGDIAEQLREVDASVVSGPTARGVYRVRLGRTIDADAALASLRGAADSVVAFAERSRI